MAPEQHDERWTGDQDSRWWLARAGEELGVATFRCARRADDATVDRQQMILNAYALYGNTAGWPSPRAKQWNDFDVMSHNIIANAVDTLVSEVTQTQPRPMAVSNGGDWSQRIRSESMTRFWDAQFDRLDVRMSAPQVTRDAIIAGLGVWRPYVDWDWRCIRLSRIFPLLLIVDDVSCVDCEPRSAWLRHFVDKWQLIEQVKNSDQYTEDRKHEIISAIKRADPTPAAYTAALPFDVSGRDVIEIIEAWHLPSVPCDDDDDDDEADGYGEEYDDDGEQAHAERDQESSPGYDGPSSSRMMSRTTDGRHVCVIANETLFDEPYTRDRFPLPTMRALAPSRGFWGDSIVMRAAPAQAELNKLLERVQDSMHLISVPRWLVQSGSINNAKITNDVGIQLEYTGAPPTLVTPNAQAPDVYQMIQILAGWIYTEFGISEMSATSIKPRGLNSGVAIDSYNDIQSKRFIGFERNFERAHVELAKELVVCQRSLSEEYPEASSVLCGGLDDTDELDFTEVDMDEDMYRVRVLPASAMVTTAAQAIEQIEKMVQAGMLPPEMGFAAMYNPDPRALLDELMAPRRNLERTFANMLRTGEGAIPDPDDDLGLGIDIARKTIQSAKLHGFPPERIQLLRDWITAANAWEKRNSQTPMGMPMDPMAAGVSPTDGVPMAPMSGMPPPGGIDPMTSAGGPIAAPGAMAPGAPM